jgi:hypothetical protein
VDGNAAQQRLVDEQLMPVQSGNVIEYFGRFPCDFHADAVTRQQENV